MKLEAPFTTSFFLWLEENKPSKTETYEFKKTNGGTYNLNTWRKKQPHQEMYLIESSTDVGVAHKIADGAGDTKFDGFFIRNADAFLVIWFSKYKSFFKIPVEDVPMQTSISYKYCQNHFQEHKLLKVNNKKEYTP